LVPDVLPRRRCQRPAHAIEGLTSRNGFSTMGTPAAAARSRKAELELPVIRMAGARQLRARSVRYDIEPAHARHVVIHEAVDRRNRRFGKQLLTAGKGANCVSLGYERRSQRVTNRVIVIHDDNEGLPCA
jgi:hypothetical protein